MDVEGLRANAPGDKAKVFGMSDGQGDFITNDYRVDIQYRGTTGVPPNAIQWRVIYGDADDLDVRYEPDTAKRFASVFLLNPATTYHWKFTWGSSIRLVMKEGGVNGNTLYDYGMAAPRGRYDPPSTMPTWARRSAAAETSRPRLPGRSTGTCGLRIARGRSRSAVRFAIANR